MELLAPAGDWDSFLAAMKNGADAVYLGGKSYSARQSAPNFDEKDLQKAVNYAHLRDKKVYVTVNTLIDNGEFSAVLDYLYQLQAMAVDAIIVQDIGLLSATRELLPGLRIHASTQMTTHNCEGVAFLRDQGVKRVVLARELSFEDIKNINDNVPEVALEVFVHGALCYSYSGQCLFSSLVGGRSGNRGRCAQPCRLAYQLYSCRTKKPIDLPGMGKHLLSPADLCLVEYLSELQKAGVSSLKIEGRMKRPEYVAIVTRAYREALDNLATNPNFRPASQVKERLLTVFNRNFSSGYFLPDREEFLSSGRPNNRGLYAGRVIEQGPDGVARIKLATNIRPGDGLAIWVKKGRGPAFIVKELKVEGRRVSQAHSGETVSLPIEGRVSPHDRVFKTHDEELLSAAMYSIRDDQSDKIRVNGQVFLALGKAMRLVLADQKGNQVETWTHSLAHPAHQYSLDEAILREKIGRLGNTPFCLAKLDINGDRTLMVPFSDINEARRQAALLLQEKILAEKRAVVEEEPEFIRRKENFTRVPSNFRRQKWPSLSVMVSSLDQAKIALEKGADRVYLAMEGIGTRKRYREEDLQELLYICKKQKKEFIPAFPRIRRPTDHLNYRKKLEPFPTLMIGNLGDLRRGLVKNHSLLADYNLNVFNHYSLRFLLNQGISQVCLSPELNFNQLQTFANFDKVEILVHGDLILMQSQYCMLKGVLGNGEKKCQVFCGKDQYYLKDEKGFKFPVFTSAECRFFVFNSRTLCLVEDLPRILSLGPASIRIEAHSFSPEQLAHTVELYREVMDRLARQEKVELESYQEKLLAVSPSPFTKGHYYRGVL